MQPQSWRNRDDRPYSNEGFQRDPRIQGGNRDGRWDRDMETEARWAERNQEDDYGSRRGSGNDWRMSEPGMDRGNDRGMDPGNDRGMDRGMDRGRSDFDGRSAQDWPHHAYPQQGSAHLSSYQQLSQGNPNLYENRGGYNDSYRDRSERSAFECGGPAFDERGYQQGRYQATGRYNDRGYAGDQNAMQQGDRAYGGGGGGYAGGHFESRPDRDNQSGRTRR